MAENPDAIGGKVRVLRKQHNLAALWATDGAREEITREEVFDMLRNLVDPEHPDMSLESLAVIRLDDIFVIPAGAPAAEMKVAPVDKKFAEARRDREVSICESDGWR